MILRPFEDPIDPVDALVALEGLSGRILLETMPPWNGRTLLAAAPQAVVRGVVGSGILHTAPWIRWPGDPPRPGKRSDGPGEEPHPVPQTGALELLGWAMDSTAAPEGEGVGAAAIASGGGWMGFLGYELNGEIEAIRPRGPPADRGLEPLPDLWFGAYDWVLIWSDGPTHPPVLSGRPLPGDRAGHRLKRRIEAVWTLLGGAGAHASRPSPDRRTLVDTLRGDLPEIPGPGTAPSPDEGPNPGEPTPGEPTPGESRRSHAGGGSPDSDPPTQGFVALDDWPGARTSLSRTEYLERVDRIRAYIRAGDLFQANLTCQVECSVTGDGVDLYRALRRKSPAPYGAYLEPGGVPVVSISPESFLHLEDGHLRTRPIKGTRPRGTDPSTDRALAAELEGSVKDAAENVMIVDLMRNDLSKIAKPNSVSVTSLLTLESHPTVHHLVSEVEGVLRDDVGWREILHALFPGGSITGAPKVRAMEVLRDLEPVPRGPYTGCIGWIGFDGAAALSIAIRTAVVIGGRARYGAGGGITLASDPAEEWDELLDKARAFLEATSPSEVPSSSREKESVS